MPGQTTEPTNPTPEPDPQFLVRYRTQISVALHGLLFVFSLFSAFALAYNFSRWDSWISPLFTKIVLVVVPSKLLVFWWLGQYRGSWRYVGLRDLFSIAWASYIGTFLFILCYFGVEKGLRQITGQNFFDPTAEFRQSVFLLDLAATIAFVCAARVLCNTLPLFNAATLHSKNECCSICSFHTGTTDSGQMIKTRL